jgi:hypothetical protein
MYLVAMYKAIAIVSVFAIAGLMLKQWLAHQLRMRELTMSQQSMTSSEARLARVEHAVEAVAIEVERISEGQRYVTKLLTERGSRAPLGLPVSAPRVDTPY